MIQRGKYHLSFLRSLTDHYISLPEVEEAYFLQALCLCHILQYVSALPGAQDSTWYCTPCCLTSAKQKKNHFCSLLAMFKPPNPGAAGHHCWPPIQLVLQDSHAKFSWGQLIPACTAAWCYPDSDVWLGLHKLPVISFFQPVPLSSCPVIHSVRHSPTCCREADVPVECAGLCSPQHSAFRS